MLVRISETGQDGVAFEIDDARVWPDVFLRVGVCADEDDSICFDGDRFGSWCFVVGGVDVAVFENDVGCVERVAAQGSRVRSSRLATIKKSFIVSLGD